MMKKNILLITAALIGCCETWAYDFTAKDANGNTICYDILSNESLTCKVSQTPKTNFSSTEVIVPNEVTAESGNGKGTTYTVTSIGDEAFYNCSNLTSVTIPESIESIGEDAFLGCRGLTSFDVPNGVKTIGSGAFFECTGLTTFTIGCNVEKIGNEVFDCCENMKSLYSNIVEPFYVEEGAFRDLVEECTLYVPAGTKEAYKSTYYWCLFQNIVEDSSLGTETEEGATKCDRPTISYSDMQLTFTSTTSGATYHYTITDSDIKSAYTTDGKVKLVAAYDISVYASAEGYNNSDIATATLYFTEATLQITTEARDVETLQGRAILVSREGKALAVSGIGNGETVALYDLSGRLISEATSADGTARLDASRAEGDVVIVKAGERTLKVKM